MNKYTTLENLKQCGLVLFTIGGLFLTAMKYPAYGLILTLISQVFWIESSYKAWKNAKQVGIFINTLVYAVITLYGVINYWFL